MSAGVSVPFGLTPHAPGPRARLPTSAPLSARGIGGFLRRVGVRFCGFGSRGIGGRTTSSYVYKYTCAPMHLSFYLLRSGLIPVRGGEVD